MSPEFSETAQPRPTGSANRGVGDEALAELLLARCRLVLWITLAAGLLFTALEVMPWPAQLPAPFYVKCVGLSVIVSGLVFVRGPWAVARVFPVAIFGVSLAYVLTAISGIVSPSGEYGTTAVSFVCAALTTATLLPWGVWPQALTVGIAAALLCIGVVLADGNLYVLHDDPAAAVVMALGISVLVAREVQQYRTALVRQLEARRRAEREIRALNVELERRVVERTAALRSANEQLRALSARLQTVREEERTRIAREIHDELGQVLTALKIDLDLLPKRITEASPDRLQEKLSAMSQLAGTMIHSVRKIAAELRPSVLDDLGLSSAIEWQAREFENRSGVRCNVVSEPLTVPVDPLRSTALFRIVQETLTNVARHANATNVRITLREDNDRLVLQVTDDGRGVTKAELSNPGSLGVLGMRERAALLGGEVDIFGAPGGGTTVRVVVPARDPDPQWAASSGAH